MKMIAMIMVAVLAMGATAQAEFILDNVDSTADWVRQHSCPETIVYSADTVDGGGSIQWVKSGLGFDIRSGVLKWEITGAPLDLSAFGPTDRLAFTFKLPADLDPELFVGIGADMGVNLLTSPDYNFSRWTVDAADIDMVFGEWVVAYAELGDGVPVPGGTGIEWDAVEMLTFHVISTYEGEIEWIRLDKIAIVGPIPEPATMGLLALGGLGLLIRRRRR